MTIWGSEMSGMASSGAMRIVYTLAATPASTRISTTSRKRMTLLMMRLIIPWRARGGKFQFVFGVDEKTTEADDLITFHQTAFHGSIQFPLNSGVDLDRNILAPLTRHVDDTPVSFFDDRFVWYGEELATHGHNLDDVIRTVWMSRARQRHFEIDAGLFWADLRHPRLKHRRLGLRRKCPRALSHLDERGFRQRHRGCQDLSSLVDPSGGTHPCLDRTDGYRVQRQRHIRRLRVADCGARGLRVVP